MADAPAIKCNQCGQVTEDCDNLPCFHMVCHEHVTKSSSDTFTCPVASCKAVCLKNKITKNLLAAEMASKKNREAGTLCENCEGANKGSAVAWCFQCFGFFCKDHDDHIHGFGVFKTHTRDYAAKTFNKYVTDRLRGLTAAEMLGQFKAADAPKKAGPRGLGPDKMFVAAARSGTATPLGLSQMAPSGDCVLHPGNVFTHLCQGHLKTLCTRCVEDIESGKPIGQTSASATSKGAQENCTKSSCRNLIDRISLADNISKVRSKIYQEIEQLTKLMGADQRAKSVFYLVKEKIDALKLELGDNLRDQNKLFRQLMDMRLATVDMANMEVAERQKHLLEEQYVRLGWAKSFNSNLVKAGKYLAEKETIECLEVQELEHLLEQLEFYGVVRVNDIPYAMGRTKLTVDEQVGDKLCNLLKVDDDVENDRFKSGQETCSNKAATANLFEMHRLYETPSEVRVVGAGDFPYFFFVRVLRVHPSEPFVRIGFMDKDSVAPEDVRMGDRTSNSWAFECAHNGELQFVRSDTGSAIPVEMVRGDSDDGSSDSAAAAAVGTAPTSVKAFRAGSTIGVYFDRRKMIAQVFVDGMPSQEVSFTKLGFKFDFLHVTPTVCLEQNGSSVRVEFARFVNDLSAVPEQYTFGVQPQ